MKARKPNESHLVTAILRALQLKGVWAWRVNSSMHVFAAQAGHARRVVKGAPAGSPDIMLVLSTDSYWMTRRRLAASDGTPIEQFSSSPSRLGVLHGIEVKTTTGKQSATQKAWQAKAEKHGVRYGVARSVSEALRLVELWSGGGRRDAK